MKKKFISIMLCIALCSTIAFFLFRKVVSDSKRSSLYGTVSAIHAALTEESSKPENLLDGLLISESEEWILLSNTESNSLLNTLNKSYNLDLLSSTTGLEIISDSWGQSFMIWYKKTTNSTLIFTVISKGPDGIYATKDDIVSGNGWPLTD
jgi:hypothetical protein